MVNIDVGARVRVRRVPETGYSAKLHNEYAGKTGTVTKSYGCPGSVLVVFDSVEMREGYPIRSCLYSIDGVEPEEKETTNECVI